MSTTEQPRVQSERGAMAAQISREIVQLHARLYGRGPTKAKTFVHDDHILCLLEDVFTPAERTLVAAGKTEHVWSTRRAFQEAVADDFLRIVQGATGRPVRAFMSAVNLDPEVSAEIFLLEPEGEGLDGNHSVDGARVAPDAASANGHRSSDDGGPDGGPPEPDGGPPEPTS